MRLILTALLAVITLSAAHADVGNSLLSLIRHKPKDAAIPAMVILKEQADLSPADKLTTREEKGRFVYDQLRATATKTQGPLVDFLTSKGVDFQRFYITNMIALYDATPALITEIAARPDVARVINNPAVKLKRPKVATEWRTHPHAPGPGANLVKIGADRVWKEFKITGEGIVVAGADTGVDWEHPALKNHYRGFDGKNVDHNYSWHDAIRRVIVEQKGKCGINSPAPCDDDQHGTHTMGTMIGDDGIGNQIGVAPGAKWMACKNMDQGMGRPTTYIECFEYFLAPYAPGADPMKDGDPSKAPNIINNSWGCAKDEGCEGDEILPAVQAVTHAGIFVVVSAGNDGPGCSTIQDSPAMYSGLSFTVGAINHRTGEIADFSSRGPSTFDGGMGPDISAPGVEVRSSVPGGTFEEEGWSGTSMAGPHVAGAVALLWSADPRLVGMIPQTKAILTDTVVPAETTETCGGLAAHAVPNNTYGFGILDAYHAVRSQYH